MPGSTRSSLGRVLGDQGLVELGVIVDSLTLEMRNGVKDTRERIEDVHKLIEATHERLDKINGRVGKGEDWRHAHELEHAKEAGRLLGAEAIRAAFSTRDKWMVGLAVPVMMTLISIVSGVVVKLLLG